MTCLILLLNARGGRDSDSFRCCLLLERTRSQSSVLGGTQPRTASHLKRRHVAKSSSDVTSNVNNSPCRFGHSESVRAIQVSSRVYHLQRFSHTICDLSLGWEKLFHWAITSCLAMASGIHIPRPGKADFLKLFPAAGCFQKVNNSSRQC